MVDTIVVARDSSGVVWHGGVGYGELVSKADTLLRQRSQVGVTNCEVIVGVLKPNDCNAVEGLALHPVLLCKPLSSQQSQRKERLGEHIRGGGSSRNQ
jgi:hypothetical protein